MISSDGMGGKTFSTNMSSRMPKYPVEKKMLMTHVAIRKYYHVSG
jgi:hypothetical protein